MKHNQEYLETIQKSKLQFKKEIVDVPMTDQDGNEVIVQQEVLTLLGTSNVKLPDCEVEIDEKEMPKVKLKELQDGSFMDREKKIIKRELKKEAKQEVQVTE